jgi:hypothetical protein
MYYRAGGNQNAAFQATLSLSDTCLEITGVLLDTVEWTSQHFLADELTLPNQRQDFTLYKLWQELQHHNVGSVYGDSSNDREYAYSLAVVAGRAVDGGPAEDNPSLHRSVYQAYKDLLDDKKDAGDASSHQSTRNALKLKPLTYLSNQRRALHNRRVFGTAEGYYGVGHNVLEVEDVCCVFRGANVPFILRRAECDEQNWSASARYRLVGEAYIQGFMKGEVLEMLGDKSPEGLAESDIIII